jgi:hypothetical protein
LGACGWNVAGKDAGTKHGKQGHKREKVTTRRGHGRTRPPYN